MAKPYSVTFWAMLALGLAAVVGFALAFVATRNLITTREELQRAQALSEREHFPPPRIAPTPQLDDGELQRLRNENAQLRAQMRAFEMSRMTPGPGRQFGGGRGFGGGRRGEQPQVSDAAAAPRNREEEVRFLELNRTNAGVVVLPSGLQYKVMTPGFGRAPRSNEMVTLNYRGVLIDGTEVDTSYLQGDSVEVSIFGVMQGWREALLRMPVGAKWRLFIPAELAYGDRGLMRRIPPNATLIYDLELISIRDRSVAGLPPAFITSPQEVIVEQREGR